MAPRPMRKSKSSEALKKCNDDPHVIAAVAMLFKNDGKVILKLKSRPIIIGFTLCKTGSGLQP